MSKRDVPFPMAANIALRCEMDLSPGIWKSPRSLVERAILTMVLVWSVLSLISDIGKFMAVELYR